ncbi:MAG: hypothetical protein QOG49_681, partial [Frankiaceae bacterium]|nr:hypothetical protein [Frankiaceae bacterium]
DAESTVVVLDPNLRVTQVISGPVTWPSVVALLEQMLPEDDSVVRAQAPVLIVPRVVDPPTCAALVDQCRRHSVETGVEKSRDGGRGDVLDAVVKRRRDVTVADPGQLHALSALIGKRVMPEVRRAFAFRATRFEGFKIAWYDESDAGFFAPHRDNLTASTAHRVFGLSINLNDEYAGGGLSFPEYGSQRYQAPAGAAMVFSCDLLHAVHPVSRGARFVLLSFLYTA